MLSHIFAKPKDLVVKELTLFILFRTITVITRSTLDTKKHLKSVFRCKKCRSMLAEPTIQLHGIIKKNFHHDLAVPSTPLEAWHSNIALASLNRHYGGLLPDTNLHFCERKGGIKDPHFSPKEDARQECRSVGS